MIDAAFLHTAIIVLPVVFFAGLVDAMAGGGGLLSLPAYLAAGLPPHLALGNNKFSSVFGTFSSTVRYFRHGMIDIPVAMTGAVAALLGSYLGARAVLLLSAHFLNYLLAVMIPLIAVFTLLKRDLGSIDSARSIPLSRRVGSGLIVALAIGFYDGFFGPGTGTFLILFYSALLHYDFVRANGNTKVLNLASNVAAVITFIAHGSVWFTLGVPAAVCGIAGNLVGSHWVVKGGSKAIRPVFFAVLLLLFGKVIFNLLRG
jgi:uncharacterized membrane protein YfcA